MTESLDSRRLALVHAAQQRWIAALTDLGGRNTLLYYKDRRAGTLDLAQADPEALDRFTGTGSIRLTRLFKDADVRADAIRRMQAIHRKARELLEERGIRAGYLAVGLARWDELFLEPAAPVLLRGLTITPTRARYDDFELVLDDDEEVNPVLVHKLASVFGAELVKLTPQNAVDRLRTAAAAAEVPGFDIADRRVIGTFTYAKLPMVKDLEAAGDLLAESDLVAAVAGDPEAQELVSAERNPGAAAATDSPEDDYSVLDADSSQPRRRLSAKPAGPPPAIRAGTTPGTRVPPARTPPPCPAPPPPAAPCRARPPRATPPLRTAPARRAAARRACPAIRGKARPGTATPLTRSRPGSHRPQRHAGRGR